MIALGLGQGSAGITAQVRLQELRRFRQHQLQMAGVTVIVAEQMQVIAQREGPLDRQRNRDKLLLKKPQGKRCCKSVNR